tara:strand:- start:58 stop:522 length:465 start_codon:yes stop_codon:yes gene_type:complete
MTYKILSIFVNKKIIIFCFFCISCIQKKSFSRKEEIKLKISNDVFIPKDFEEKEMLFLNQIIDKKKYYSNYEVRITNKLHVTSNDWRFFIQNKNNIGAIKLIIEVSKNFYDKISRDLSYEIKNIEMGETLKCLNNCFLNLNSSIEKKTIKCDCK